MSGNVEVLRSGLVTIFCELPNYKRMAMGLSGGGVVDVYAYGKLNELIGNYVDTPVLEINQLGPELLLTVSCRFAITGAFCNAFLDEKAIEVGVLYFAKAGQILRVDNCTVGARSYLGFQGGIEGLTLGQSIKKGDNFRIQKTQTSGARVSKKFYFDRDYLQNATIEVFRGPEYFIIDGFLKEILGKCFKVSSTSNRMGIRLQTGLNLEIKEMRSVVVQPGTVQFTPAGELIILGVDGQVTGGYPRVFQLSDLGMRVLSQKQAGDSIQFKLLDFNTA